MYVGGARINIGGIFNDFWTGISTQVTELGQHFLNQGLAAVLGGLGSLGSRGISDIFSCKLIDVVVKRSDLDCKYLCIL